MPQDTLRIGLGQDEYVILNNDSFPIETREQLHNAAQEKGYEKKPASNEWLPFLIVVGMFVLIGIIIRIRDGRSKAYVALGSMVNNETDYDIDEEGETIVIKEPDYLLYEGNELNFTDAEISTILNKRSIYFVNLTETDKEKFIYRLKKFISQKTFFIHDKSGYKEMPVLISSAAIQLSFGREKYLLPDFPHIHIFPEEFIGTGPSIRYLEGNVSNNAINISWKHFLNGFNDPADGQNVGLHEMAHAYYFQNVETTDNKDHNFIYSFSRFNNAGNKIFEKEQEPGNDLYSSYALKDFQEFWAESVEIFFEKPIILKATYPDLYAAMSDLLNQDPANMTSPA